MLEYAQYVINYDGTTRDYVETMLHKGYDVVLEIEVQGALQVEENYPNGGFMFLFPLSLDELTNRVFNRGTESNDLVINRLKEAKKEIELMDAYDYVVVNDNVHHAVEKIKSIIQSEHCRRERIAKQYKKIL